MAMLREDPIEFQDIFTIKDIDPEGKKFDTVSRLKARSENYDMDLLLDFNTELYPLEIDQKFSLVLTDRLNHDNTSNSDLSDEYEYVMYGKIYRFEEPKTSDHKVAVYVSFGGLLMCLEGDQKQLHNMIVGENIYLLMRK